MLLWALMQYGSGILIFFVFLFMFFILIIVCSAIELWSKQKRERLDRAVLRSRYNQGTSRFFDLTPQRRGLRRSTDSWSRSRAPRRLWAPGMPDPSSSPVGGTCLHCGAPVREETSSVCPECGVERQRCPICQRYIAGGQDLLACPYCLMPGHANELIIWVQNKGTCPYCARKISTRMLVPYQPPVNEHEKKSHY